jgi:hypothetical protein
MKLRIRYLLPVLLVAASTACVQDAPNKSTAGRGNVQNITVKVFDGCEYLEYDYGLFDQRVYSLTHKGNCKNPIHACGVAAKPTTVMVK